MRSINIPRVRVYPHIVWMRCLFSVLKRVHDHKIALSRCLTTDNSSHSDIHMMADTHSSQSECSSIRFYSIRWHNNTTYTNYIGCYFTTNSLSCWMWRTSLSLSLSVWFVPSNLHDEFWLNGNRLICNENTELRIEQRFFLQLLVLFYCVFLGFTFLCIVKVHTRTKNTLKLVVSIVCVCVRVQHFQRLHWPSLILCIFHLFTAFSLLTTSLYTDCWLQQHPTMQYQTYSQRVRFETFCIG